MTENSKTASPSDLKLEGITPKVSQPQDESHDKDKLVEIQQERRKLQHKILKRSEKPLKSAYGINYVMRKVGRDKPALSPSKKRNNSLIFFDASSGSKI